MSGLSNWKILVIEDEKDSMDVLIEILGFYNIQAFPAYNAEEALGFLQHTVPTLIICDLALPAMDGWGLLKEIRGNAETAHVPVIAVTAFHSATVAQEAIEAGFDAYFPKPIESTSFVRELERVVAQEV